MAEVEAGLVNGNGGKVVRRPPGKKEQDGGAFARERVHQAIRSAIARRTMVPGQQIPEVELAASLGVSRTPVREALRELEQQGLVVSYPHRGSFIRALSGKDIENLVYLRAAVEGMAAWQAVENASRAQVRQLEHLVDQMEQSVPVGESAEFTHLLTATAEIDLEFHETLVSLSGNDELVRAWRWVDPLIRTMLGHHHALNDLGATTTLPNLIERHRQVIRALLTGDAAQAEQAARMHVISAGQRVIASMRRIEADSATGADVSDLALYRRRNGR